MKTSLIISAALVAIAGITTTARAERQAACSCSVSVKVRPCHFGPGSFSWYCRGSSPLQTEYKSTRLPRYDRASPGRCESFCERIERAEIREASARYCDRPGLQIASRRRASFAGRPLLGPGSERTGYRGRTRSCRASGPGGDDRTCEVDAQLIVRGRPRGKVGRRWRAPNRPACKRRIRRYLGDTNPCKTLGRRARARARLVGGYRFGDRLARFSTRCTRMHGYELR